MRLAPTHAGVSMRNGSKLKSLMADCLVALEEEVHDDELPLKEKIAAMIEHEAEQRAKNIVARYKKQQKECQAKLNDLTMARNDAEDESYKRGVEAGKESWARAIQYAFAKLEINSVASPNEPSEFLDCLALAMKATLS